MIDPLHARRLVALVAVGTLALGAAACGGGGAEKKATETVKVKVKEVPTIVTVPVATEK